MSFSQRLGVTRKCLLVRGARTPKKHVSRQLKVQQFCLVVIQFVVRLHSKSPETGVKCNTVCSADQHIQRLKITFGIELASSYECCRPWKVRSGETGLGCTAGRAASVICATSGVHRGSSATGPGDGSTGRRTGIGGAIDGG
jgi:hypothetical protein